MSKWAWAAPTPVIDEQLFRFPKEDKYIREGEDINPITNSDITTNDIPVPLLATPINISLSQKTSNSWNVNPNSHQKTPKSAPPPTTYAELYEAKTDWRISWEREKWSLEGEFWLKQEETKKYLEYDKIQHAKEVEYQKLQHKKEEKKKYYDLQLLLVKKDREASTTKQENDFVLDVGGSSCSVSKTAKISQLLKR
ncbi:hypothetical protein BY996DRAFT_6621450 [Phakopsora pachyrhizi]|nr:hypothetical protein BY996DRAFT_6621450 [Phakopsora pachyrhizi]